MPSPAEHICDAIEDLRETVERLIPSPDSESLIVTAAVPDPERGALTLILSDGSEWTVKAYARA